MSALLYTLGYHVSRKVRLTLTQQLNSARGCDASLCRPLPMELQESGPRPKLFKLLGKKKGGGRTKDPYLIR